MQIPEEKIGTPRPPHPDDQDNADITYEILLNTILNYGTEELEAVHWVSAMWTLIAERYCASGLTYEQSCFYFQKASENYRYLWEQENDSST